MSGQVQLEVVKSQVLEYVRNTSGSNRYIQTFDLGSGIFLDLNIAAGSAIRADMPVSPDLFKFSMNFRSGSYPNFRIDNSGQERRLHYHLISGSLHLADHKTLDHDYSLSELVEFAFETGSSILSWLYPAFRT